MFCSCEGEQDQAEKERNIGQFEHYLRASEILIREVEIRDWDTLLTYIIELYCSDNIPIVPRICILKLIVSSGHFCLIIADVAILIRDVDTLTLNSLFHNEVYVILNEGSSTL